jgi:hypothetical protein
MQQRILRIAMEVCGRLAVLAKRQRGLAFILALVIWKLFPMLLLAALGFILFTIALLWWCSCSFRGLPVRCTTSKFAR